MKKHIIFNFALTFATLTCAGFLLLFIYSPYLTIIRSQNIRNKEYLKY